jgi:hypothetical protein
MTEPSDNELEQEREAIEDLDLDQTTANDISGGAYEAYIKITGQKQGDVKGP